MTRKLLPVRPAVACGVALAVAGLTGALPAIGLAPPAAAVSETPVRRVEVGAPVGKAQVLELPGPITSSAWICSNEDRRILLFLRIYILLGELFSTR